MNKDDSGESSSCAVRSKYFTCNSAMDESLSEFQETKKSFTGPKNTVKKISKPRKAPKRPRNQKDIRTALRTKKNDLETYSKDFDKVCKKAGIDVDSEQLQLAIALSKSLQDRASTSSEPAEGSQTTTQDRIGKIKTTLREYGFKVPDIKISGNNRKTRKIRTNYKLIQTSEVEKKEIIANRYSQILFENITHCSLNCSDIDATDIPLYNLASNAAFGILQKQDTFYVDNLIEKSTSTGNLLKDWSKIPGRPESPKLFEAINMNFSEIECSQEELEIILSGTIKHCKDIVSKKMKDWVSSNACEDKENNINVENNDKNVENNQQFRLTVNEDVELIVDPNPTVNKCRSDSPDMFDDDVSDVFENSQNLAMKEYDSQEVHKTNINLEVMDLTESVKKSQPMVHLNSNVTNRKSNEMELTECIEITTKSYCTTLSQKTDSTKRRSNDFMELTECVATSSQPVHDNINLTLSPEFEENILRNASKKDNSANSNSHDVDLTQSSGNDDNENRNTPNELNTNKDIESMDLTQNSNTSDELPFVSLTVTREESSNDTIFLDINDYAYINKRLNSLTDEIHIDLTQNIDEAIVQSQSFFGEYIHNHSDSPDQPNQNDSNIIIETNYSRIDLTQSPERRNSDNSNRKCKESLKGNISEHSCSSQIAVEPISAETHSSNSPIKSFGKTNLTLSPMEEQSDNNTTENIDLTQTSDTSEELSKVSKNDCPNISKKAVIEINVEDATIENEHRNSQRCSSLGKKDDVSIDYDDIIRSDANDEFVYSKSINIEAISCEIDENVANFSKHNSFISSCSQNSEVFEISDKELDYSLHKSKLEMPKDNFAFGGISIMDNLSTFGTSKKSIEVDNNSIVNDVEMYSLPAISKKIGKCNEISPIKHRRITEIVTPQKQIVNNITVVTPKNSEMIIKTNNVTPMRDYESMSTPDIHKELDKYGIKPFKRKRAIQLLTHIYNETHPIIDTADELSSPPKRRKPNDSSPKKHISPRKLLTTPEKAIKDIDYSNKNKGDIDKENENNIEQSKENNNTKKGKGKGKRSVENRKKDASEKVDGCIEIAQNRCKTIDANEVPNLKEIDCSPEDWVFQKREKAKLHSCRVPLHIAFYNYVSSRRDLREAILCYEPVEIDLIHKELVGFGHRYDPKDLLRFLDKKCITVKTTDNDARNNR